MKVYTFEVTITEGCDEFWEDLHKENLTGIDEILKDLRIKIANAGWVHSSVNFKAYREDV